MSGEVLAVGYEQDVSDPFVEDFVTDTTDPLYSAADLKRVDKKSLPLIGRACRGSLGGC